MYVEYTGNWCCMPECLLETFKKWAVGAEVLHVAE